VFGRAKSRALPNPGCTGGSVFGVCDSQAFEKCEKVGTLRSVDRAGVGQTKVRIPTLTSKSATLGWGTRLFGLVFEFFWVFSFDS
jgi:hypothetical protein